MLRQTSCPSLTSHIYPSSELAAGEWDDRPWWPALECCSAAAGKGGGAGTYDVCLRRNAEWNESTKARETHARVERPNSRSVI